MIFVHRATCRGCSPAGEDGEERLLTNLTDVIHVFVSDAECKLEVGQIILISVHFAHYTCILWLTRRFHFLHSDFNFFPRNIIGSFMLYKLDLQLEHNSGIK